jgi:hypothetical protein
MGGMDMKLIHSQPNYNAGFVTSHTNAGLTPISIILRKLTGFPPIWKLPICYMPQAPEFACSLW